MRNINEFCEQIKHKIALQCIDSIECGIFFLWMEGIKFGLRVNSAEQSLDDSSVHRRHRENRDRVYAREIDNGNGKVQFQQKTNRTDSYSDG